MGAAAWVADSAVTESPNSLESRFGNYDFLQLVRVLLRPREVGQAPLTPDQALRFRADLGGGFPGRNASALQLLGQGATTHAPLLTPTDQALLPTQHDLVQITTPDFCVGSALGPLPDPFLEWVRELDQAGKPAMREFLDLFNHRFNVLRYEARAVFEPGLNNLAPEHTVTAQWLGALMGIGCEAAASQLPLRPRNWLGIGELLANSRRSPAALVQVLTAHLDCPVALTPLVPAWRPLGIANQHALGQRRLGQDSRLGRRVWDVQAAVKLTLGPLPYAAMVDLLPSSEPSLTASATASLSARDLQRQWRASQTSTELTSPNDTNGYATLVALVRLMLDRRHDAEIEILVPERSIPPSHLRTQPAQGQVGMRLGQTAWLKSRSRPGAAGAIGPGARAHLRSVRLHVNAFDTPAPQQAVASTFTNSAIAQRASRVSP